MRSSLAFASFLAVSLAAGIAAAGPLKPSELLAEPERYLNKTVDVQIVERLYGPSTEAALKASEYGGMEVMIPDSGGGTVKLVPAAFKPGDPNRFKNKFEGILRAPLRVKGEFLKDDEMSASMRRPYYVLRVASWEPAALEAPVTATLEEIKKDPAKWDRKRVIYDGRYENRFEVSSLDQEIWLSFANDAEISGQRPKPEGGFHKSRVRVTGVLFSKPGAHYGHLGGYAFEILASKVEYMDPL